MQRMHHKQRSEHLPIQGFDIKNSDVLSFDHPSSDVSNEEDEFSNLDLPSFSLRNLFRNLTFASNHVLANHSSDTIM